MTDEKQPAESSSAQFAPPSDPEAYARWRQTGEMPGDAPAAEATEQKPSKPADAAAADKPSESAPASDTGKSKQESRERTTPKRDDAASRLQELLADLKEAGLSPAELKTFKRNAEKEAAKTETPAPPAVEELKAPEKPKLENFDDYSKYEEAMEGYHEKMADYRVEKAFRERAAKDAEEAGRRSANERFEAAVEHYGENSGEAIRATAKTLFEDKAIPAAVKQLVNESPLVAHLMYVMGSKDGELKSFIDLAKANPGEAIRKAVLLEHLISQELKGAAKPDSEAAPGRDASGKFTSPATPAKKTTTAPAPPTETGGRSAAPADTSDGAFNANDFRAFRDAENAKDIARLSGR